ncbi:MAG: heat shock protein HspQ [Gammaproteobacteria bacterium]|nr:heat shock protein HspQ [Gammaproteobacteria bacterium]
MPGESRFSIGQIVHHRRFNYRGVIVQVDPVFRGTEAWYQQMATSTPPKERPWYHVLVDQSARQTYVAEQNLELSADLRFIEHPAVPLFFEAYWDGVFVPRPIVR